MNIDWAGMPSPWAPKMMLDACYAAANRTHEHLLEAQEKQQAAAKRLNDLSNGTCSGEVVEVITLAQQDLTNLEQSHNNLLADLPTSLRRSPYAARLAQRVFDIPEILEHILHFLTLYDAFRAQQVNKQFFTSIQRSTKIQRGLGFQADPGPFLRLPPDLRLIGLSFQLSLPPLPPTEAEKNTIMVDIDVVGPFSAHALHPTKLPRLGAKARSILICQPPVTHIDAFTSCCCHSPWFARHQGEAIIPIASMDVKSGITIGNLLDMDARLQTEHRLCPTAALRLHDSNGYVNQSISLQATFPAHEKDPELASLLSQRHERDTLVRERQERENRLRPYLAAKQIGMLTPCSFGCLNILTANPAHANALPIPTLAEFEAISVTNEG